MRQTKGFTLIEILVVMMIVSTLAIVAVPSYNTYINQGAAKAAQNNLTNIATAQKSYYFNNNSYCTGACGSESAINSTLGLNIIDSNFTYSCSTSGSGYSCTATAVSIPGGLTLTLNETSNNTIVLTGGTGCATPAGGSCNPACTPAASSYCP